MSKFLTLTKQIESLIVGSIKINPSSEDEQTGAFFPGASTDQRKLRVRLDTDIPFPRRVCIHLSLVAIIDSEGAKHAVTPPIQTVYQVSTISNTHFVDLIGGTRLPVPDGVLYLESVQQTCPPQIMQGNAEQYVLLLSTSRFRGGAISKPAIPLVAHVLSGAKCDIKCEKVATSSEPSEQHPLKIFCKNSNSTLYASVPHCVTHCQAPRPIFQFVESDKRTDLKINTNQCKCCNE